MIMTSPTASSPVIFTLDEDRRESRKWRDAPEKALRPEDILVKQAGASQERTDLAIVTLASAIQKCGIENEIATYMKRTFDEAFGPSWQCIVGRNFGSHLDCVEFVHLSLSKISIILFRSR